MIQLPALYPILDAGALAAAALPLEEAGIALRDAGVRWLQYRDKQASDRDFVDRMRVLRGVFPRGEAVLLVNDRVRLCAESEADGVHIGQEDMAPQAARRLIGQERILGVSTHNAAQVRSAALAGAPDYLAIGPVFVTLSKENPDPFIGLEGVRAARAATTLPLVAIGGITNRNGRAVIEAGADAVAVISGLLPVGSCGMAERVRDFLAFLR